MNDERNLRRHVVNLLDGTQAHVSFEDAVRGVPAKLRGARVGGLPYTLWRLLEHMRIAQWDILEFSRRATHVSPEFPGGYWPRGNAPPSACAWDQSVRRFRVDVRAMRALVLNPKTDLFARIAHGSGQTILREAMLVADHNAYHLGQFVMLRRLLGNWKES